MKTVTSPNLRYGDQVFSIVLKTPRRFARGGLVKAASKVREAGRYGDDMLVHMNKAEFEQIKKAWGQPTYNPKTGLPEYFSLGSLIPVAGALLGGILGSKHSSNGAPAPPTDPNLTARLPQWTNQRTVIPHTNPSDYFTYGQSGNPHPGEFNFFGNNSLASIGPPPAPAPATHYGGPPGNLRGHARGGPAGYAFGGPVGIGMAPPGPNRGMPPPNVGQMGLSSANALPPPPNPQLGVMRSPPAGGGMASPAMVDPSQWAIGGARPGGAGSMPGSSMALQRPQGPAGAPAMGGLGQGYARPQMGMRPWQGGGPGAQRFSDGGPAYGPGTGRSDDIHAKLSDGEYVMDAETVSLLGDGSTNAGASKLDAMRKAIRSHKGPALAKGKFTPKAKLPLDYLNDMAARDDMNRNLRKGIK